jgi:peptide chain release factor 1
MREGRGRRRIGVVVSGDVNRLDRRDRSFLRRRDALLQLAHLGEERRLISDGGRHAAEQRRHLRPCLGETEDIVDEEQHVLPFRVAEVFGDGQRRKADAETRAGWLGHLSVDQRRARLRHVLHVDDAGLLEFEPQIVAFARAFTDTAKHGDTAVLQGDVVNQLHDDDGLADAGAAEEANLASLEVRLE